MRPFLGGKACSFFGTCEELRFIYKNQRGENCEWKKWNLFIQVVGRNLSSIAKSCTEDI